MQELTHGWNSDHTAYVCVDEKVIGFGNQVTIEPEEDDKDISQSDSRFANGIVLADCCRVRVSNTALSRNMDEISKCSKRAVTVTFPRTIRAVAPTAFYDMRKLRAAVVNEGLEALGDSELEATEDHFCAFGFTGITRVRLPQTLKVLGNRALSHNSLLTSICLPDGLEVIGAYCFDWTLLTEVTVPGSVTETGDCAFYHCHCLETVTFPKESRLRKIGASAFANSGLKDVTFPDSLIRVGCTAFCGCENLRHVEINDTIQDIGALCFSGTRVRKLKLPGHIMKTPKELGIGCGCKNVPLIQDESYIAEEDSDVEDPTVVVIRNNVKALDESQFDDAANLQKVIFQEVSRLEQIGNECFSSSGLREFVAPPSLREIADGAFYDCTRLKRIVLNEGLEVLGNTDNELHQKSCFGVFEDSAVESVTLPSTLKRIENSAFYGCEYLKGITLPQSLERVGYSCFEGSGLRKVLLPSAVAEIPEDAFYQCGNLKSVEFAKNARLEKIGNYAFFMTRLRTFTAPPSLKVICHGAFHKCEHLRRVLLNEGLEALGRDKCPDSEKEWYGVFQGSAVREVRLPSTLKVLEYKTFAECKKLTQLRLPEGLEEVGSRCFMQSGIKEIALPDGVTEIPERTFFQCKNLRSVTFGADNKLEIIGANAFDSTAFAVFVAPPLLREIQEGAFCGCKHLKSVKFPNSLETIQLGAFHNSGLEELVTPPSLRTIAQGAFSRCGSLKRVQLNEGLETLGTKKTAEEEDDLCGVFERSSLNEVTLPSTLRRIEYRTFMNCKNLTHVTLPAGLESIERKCFSLSGVRELTVPDSVIEIRDKAFCECANLKSVTFGKNGRLEKIGDKVFRNTRLESFTAPASLREIGIAAFCGCKRLRHVELNDTLERISWFCFYATPLKGLELPEKVCASGVDVGIDCAYKSICEVPQKQTELTSLPKAAKSVEAVVIPASVKQIGENVFAEAKRLRAVVFPFDSSLEKIGSESFRASGLEKIRLPKGLVEIGENAFRGCENLKKVTFEEGSVLKKVGKGAFAGTPLRPEDVCFPKEADVSEAFALEEPANQ